MTIDRNTGYVSLNKNEAVSKYFDDKLQVFQTSKDYNTHWEREAFRVYFGNKLTSNANNSKKLHEVPEAIGIPDEKGEGHFHTKSLGKPVFLNKINKMVQNSINEKGLIQTIYLSMRMITRDITRPSRRVLLIGATKYVLKRTENG